VAIRDGFKAIGDGRVSKRYRLPTHVQGKEKQRDCLLFLFLVLQFASDVFFLFFSPFSPGRCAGPVRAFWVFFCVFNGNFRQFSRNFGQFCEFLRL
jgi:hypothetical protein